MHLILRTIHSSNASNIKRTSAVLKRIAFKRQSKILYVNVQRLCSDSQYDSMLFTTKYKIKNYTRVPNTPEEKCYYTKNFNTILKANKMY